MKKRINFQKLIDGKYSLDEQLHIFDWMLNTGIKYERQYGRWNINGVSQLLFGYSGNNEAHKLFPIGINCKDVKSKLNKAFISAIVKTPYCSIISEWKYKNNIFLGTVRMIDIPEIDLKKINKNRYGYMRYGLEENIERILTYYTGKKLNESPQPEYKDRVNPYIINCSLCTSGNGFQVIVYYSFDMDGFENNSWSFYELPTENFNLRKQEENENIFNYTEYVIDYIDKRIIMDNEVC